LTTVPALTVTDRMRPTGDRFSQEAAAFGQASATSALQVFGAVPSVAW
jgi:hypothetical protein